jgi:hypothetical protein
MKVQGLTMHHSPRTQTAVVIFLGITNGNTRNLPPLAVGSQLRIASVNLGQSPVSIVLISSPSCTYCLASASFHAKLVSESASNGVPFYVAVPSRSEANRYLLQVGFSDPSIKEWKDLNLRANATPTIAAVDKTGSIRRVWVGLLSPDSESELVKMIQTHTVSSLPSTSESKGAQSAANYSSLELENLKMKEKIKILDVHERGFPGIRDGAVTMPMLELEYRAPFELNRDDLQIIDCGNLGPSQCELSVRLLSKEGFRVATLDGGLYWQSCDATTVQ